LGEARREIFFGEGLDDPNQIDPAQQIAVLAQQALLGPSAFKVEIADQRAPFAD
jgi:hypothetical protein